MKKKTYNQPQTEMAEVLLPMTIVCASITEGDPITSGEPPVYTD